MVATGNGKVTFKADKLGNLVASINNNSLRSADFDKVWKTEKRS